MLWAPLCGANKTLYESNILILQCLYVSLHSSAVMSQHNVIYTFAMLKHMCGNILEQCQKQSKVWHWAELFVECSVGREVVGAHGGILVQPAAHQWGPWRTGPRWGKWPGLPFVWAAVRCPGKKFMQLSKYMEAHICIQKGVKTPLTWPTFPAADNIKKFQEMQNDEWWKQSGIWATILQHCGSNGQTISIQFEDDQSEDQWRITLVQNTNLMLLLMMTMVLSGGDENDRQWWWMLYARDSYAVSQSTSCPCQGNRGQQQD